MSSIRLKMSFKATDVLRRFAAVENGAVLRTVREKLRPRVEAEVEKMKGRVSRGYSSKTRKQKTLQRRSGRLAEAIGSRTKMTAGVLGGRGLAIEIGVLRGSKKVQSYALAQELGTVGAGGELPDIKPSRSKFLMIPQNAALSATGEQNFTPRQAKQMYDNVYFVQDKSGGGSSRVFMYGTNGGTSELLFIGVKSVAIPPHPFVSSGAKDFENDAVAIGRKVLYGVLSGDKGSI